MSAVLGRVERNGGKIDPASFTRANDLQKRYGGDLTQSKITEIVGVGCQILSLKRSEPIGGIHGNGTSLLVVADAVLDNRTDLRGKLEVPAAEFQRFSDAEVIFHCFKRWGEDCLHFLEGDFAFACVYSMGSKVVLARDHIGTRPLFWAMREGSLIFATSIEAIVSFDEFDWTINEQTVSEYLAHPYIPVSGTFFSEIEAVPAGGVVTIEEARVTKKRWWNPPTNYRASTISRDHAISECRRLLERAIRVRVDTSFSVGSHISGGLDSTGVTILAARTLKSTGQKIKAAYSWSPPISKRHEVENRFDERLLLNEIASDENIEIGFGTANAKGFLEFIERPIEFEGAADLADELPVLKQAHRDDIRILLSGWGGDEAFSSYGPGYFGNMISRGKWLNAKRFAKSFQWSLSRPSVFASVAWREVILPMLPRSIYFVFDNWKDWRQRYSLISKTLLGQHKRNLDHHQKYQKIGLNPNDNLKNMIVAGHITERMETWAAWSSSYNLQYRYPLTDKRLLEFLFTLPPELILLDDKPRGLAIEVLRDCKSSRTHKEDFANEELRADTRIEAWDLIAQTAASERSSGLCRWINTSRLAAKRSTPAPPETTHFSTEFFGMFVALRIGNLHDRAKQNKWLKIQRIFTNRKH